MERSTREKKKRERKTSGVSDFRVTQTSGVPAKFFHRAIISVISCIFNYLGRLFVTLYVSACSWAPHAASSSFLRRQFRRPKKRRQLNYLLIVRKRKMRCFVGKSDFVVLQCASLQSASIRSIFESKSDKRLAQTPVCWQRSFVAVFVAFWCWRLQSVSVTLWSRASRCVYGS